MTNPDRARKLLVRSALVTSTTIATLVGAQNLAMLDTQQLTATPSPNPEAAIMHPLPENATPISVQQVAPTLEIRQAAPSIIVLRRAGDAPTQSGVVGSAAPQDSAVVVVQPPASVQIDAPNPIIVQQPILQSGRSSR